MANNFLASKIFWSSVSSAAVAGALISFHSTQQYTDNFTNSGKYIFSVIITFHLIIFFSNPNTIKTTFIPFFGGSAKKWAIRFTAFRAALLLYLVSEQTEIGLVFVICVWINAVAIGRILRVSYDLWFANGALICVVNRSIDLYSYSGRYWLVMLFCFLLSYLDNRLDDYERIKEIVE